MKHLPNNDSGYSIAAQPIHNLKLYLKSARGFNATLLTIQFELTTKYAERFKCLCKKIIYSDF